MRSHAACLSPLRLHICLTGLCLLTCSLLSAADDLPPDPSEKVIAEGEFSYFQRDLDALVMVARRHLGRPFQGDEEQKVRASIRAMFLAREALRRERNNLPDGFSATQRDRLVLDILDYQAKAVTRSAAAQNPPAAATQAGSPGTGTKAGTSAATTSSDLVSLPRLELQRQDANNKIWNLQVGITLSAAPDMVQRIKQRQPIIQDQLLQHFHGLTKTDFTRLDLNKVRKGIEDALLRAAIAGDPESLPRILITSFSLARQP